MLARRCLVALCLAALALTAAPAAAAPPIPSDPNTRASSGTMPGVASSMPTIAVNTISATTFGLHSAT